MNDSNNFNNLYEKKKILVAPLEWGLGHATRCIPIIHELISQGCEVLIAAEGATNSLLKKEFRHLQFLPLMGYRMRYSRKKIFLPVKIFLQLPKIIFTIYKEHQWLKKIIKQYKIDAVISDNRFGLYSKKIRAVYITHQLSIKTGNIFTEKFANKIHNHFIKKFDECWVPDFKENGLAGKLSHPQKLPEKIKYLGCLSRFELKEDEEKKYDVLISISGPEPQRTLFEKKILKDLKSYKGKALFIRGLPEKSAPINFNNSSVEIKDHLDAKKFNEAILQSDIVISRCGYTTIMDLVKLQKKAILIPTPGQTEQEYLACYLMKKNLFYTVEQKNFSLQKNIKGAAVFPFNIPQYDMEQYKIIISQFVLSL